MHPDLSNLHNTYYIIRHGRSLANDEGVILSDPKNGIGGYGLSDKGKEEVRQSVTKAKEEGVLDSSIVIVSSDFTRARETAEITAEILGVDVSSVELTPKLRERFFGQWEKTPNTNYEKVWQADKDDFTHTNNHVESVSDVADRVMALINQLENNRVHQIILLVSHGDTLQILQALFEQVHPSQHRSLIHLKTAEIRKIN